MNFHHTLVVVLSLVIGTAPAFASNANETCVAMAKEEGVYNDKTDAACACTAENIAGNATLQQNLKDASSKAPGDEREAVYTPDMLAIFDACGPWT